jgi:DNA ligase-1
MSRFAKVPPASVPRRNVLLGLAAACWPSSGPWAARDGGWAPADLSALALPLGQPPALLLAELAPPLGAGLDLGAYLVSEKYDGMRAYWDGHSLRFRSGASVPAPDWFTAALPPQPLDGELWLGRGRFEALSAIVRRGAAQPAGWQQVRYLVYELPEATGSFEQRAGQLARLVEQAGSSQLQAAAQRRVADAPALQTWLDEVVAAGGEGLMLHRADAPYLVGRQPALLKLKPVQDAEAVVIAHQPGQGRLAGLMGALRVRTPDGLTFWIGTGFSDADRADPPAIGSQISYRYRGLTARGVPRFASYLRRRDEP